MAAQRNRRALLVALSFVLAVPLAGLAATAGLGRADSGVTGRPPVAVADLNSMDGAFRAAVGRENRMMRTLIANPKANADGSDVFAEDVVVNDATAGVRVVGRSAVVGQWRMVAMSMGHRQIGGLYAGRDGGVFVDGWWGVMGWTKQKPGREWFEIGLRDGLWASVLMIYDRGTLNGDFASAIGVSLNPKLVSGFAKLLARYATAWSSGDPKAVAALYAPNALRQDMVFGDSEQGRTAIRDYAAQYFGWYPSVQTRLVRPFGDGRMPTSGHPAMGGQISIRTTGQDGRPCTVNAAAMLETKNGLITKERVYYDAASLKTCGWAQ
jgi:ketosteroid isomerase-like protein